MDCTPYASRRNSSAELIINFNRNLPSEFVTPVVPHIRRRSCSNIMKAPAREKQTAQRISMTKGLIGVRKKLNFDACGDNNPIKNSLYKTALRNNDLAVPFTDLEESSLKRERFEDLSETPRRSKKRVIFEDELSVSPCPETPIESSFRSMVEMKLKSNKQDYTKICKSLGPNIILPKLFDTGNLEEEKAKVEFPTRRTARNLTVMWK